MLKVEKVAEDVDGEDDQAEGEDEDQGEEGTNEEAPLDDI